MQSFWKNISQNISYLKMFWAYCPPEMRMAPCILTTCAHYSRNADMQRTFVYWTHQITVCFKTERELFWSVSMAKKQIFILKSLWSKMHTKSENYFAIFPPSRLERVLLLRWKQLTILGSTCSAQELKSMMRSQWHFIKHGPILHKILRYTALLSILGIEAKPESHIQTFLNDYVPIITQKVSWIVLK